MQTVELEIQGDYEPALKLQAQLESSDACL